ncbi:MAG TPA: membrane protein [Actinomycetota bacterium]
MKKAPRIRGGIAIRSVCLVVGLAVIAAGIVAMLVSGLGVPPWDVLHVGIALHTPLSVGEATVVVGLLVLGVGWAVGATPGVGTVANAIEIGLLVDVFRSLSWVEDLAGAGLLPRLGLVVFGVVCFGVGSALYIGAGLGAGPRDGLMLVLAHRTGRRIALVRGMMEVVVLLVGAVLGGPVGIGTAAFALTVGPAVEACFWLMVRAGLATPPSVRIPVP